jgi:hypothetical protein
MPDNASSDFSLVSLGQFGDRARPLQGQMREASLIIGLGQVGLQAVTQAHELLNALLAKREMQNNVRLLAIARRRSIREEARLPREARLVLNMDQIAWSDVPGRYAPIGVAKWWPHSPRDARILEDPTQVRAYSRLILFDNAALISETLFKLARWLGEVGTGRSLDLERRVYVLASLAEAEGSGMIFDIVSRLRALAGDQATQIVGLFSLRAPQADHDPDRIQAMANVYATLREIDAYTLHPETYPSTLPVIGHSLSRGQPRPALDMIFLTDDAMSDSPEPPGNSLAECVTTWIAASLLEAEQAPALPAPLPLDGVSDRLSIYSTFGVSKLALPTRAAMNLAAVGVAQATLRAVKSARTGASLGGWAGHMLTLARAALLDSDLAREPEVDNRLREWSADLSANGLSRKLDARANKGENIRLIDLAQSEWRRLEREVLSESAALNQGLAAAPSDTLRARVDVALDRRMRDTREKLLDSPADLAYIQGHGLAWTASALEELEQQIRHVAPDLRRQLDEAEAAFQVARSDFFEVAQPPDGRGGGRSRKAASPDLDARATAALAATVELISIQARQDAWRTLRELVEGLLTQVREVLPLADQAVQSLGEFEATCRQAMGRASSQPPRYPAGVVLTEEWYVSGIQKIANLGQLPPRDLVARVYAAWGGGGLPPERRLSGFLLEIRDAARRALAASFAFADLYQFLSQNEGNPIYDQALSALPGAATPALVPTSDEKYPPATPYEIVREAPRPLSVIGAPQLGVRRSFVPSPDPDEITVVRVLHGLMAEAIPALRETYRRAYDRAGAEGMPLHADRRWDSTMADLVHTTARREISMIWENLLTTLRQNPRAIHQPMNQLSRAFAVALDVVETLPSPPLASDFRLAVYKLRPFRLKLPPPHCAVLFLYSNRSAEELSKEIFQALTPLPLEEQFAFVVNITRRPDIEEIVEPLRRVDFTILVLEEADIKHLIGARLPTRALSDLVLDQVSLTTVSPFYTRGPVPEHMFFGREREIAEVRSKLRTHSVALIGGRRIGKTSTLQRIQRSLEPEESDYVPYYLDCHGATNYRSYFWLINRRWGVDIAQDANPVQFEEVIAQLAARHPGKNLAILFDEVDSLLNFDRAQENQETLFRTFRSLSNEKRCQYIFSGEKWLMRSIADPYSALFNFSQAVRLQPLPPKVVHQLVADPFEMLNVWVEQSEQVINRIYQISAGHPNIVQMICQAMVEELDQDPQNASLLTVDHLDRATSRRTLQEEIVQTIWGQMSPLARLITLTWPEGQRFLSLTDIENLLAEIGVESIPPERLERTARDLELYCFVRPRENDQLELIPMAFPAILDFMTDKKRQIEIVRRHYEADPQGAL